MSRLRLRTRFLFSMLLISAGLTSTSLLLVRNSVKSHVREGIVVDLRNSVSTFENFQRERENSVAESPVHMMGLHMRPPDQRNVL